MPGDPLVPLEALYQSHAPALLAYLTRSFGSCASPEDLLQETFAQALRRSPQVMAADSPRAFLFGIARHLGLSAARRAKFVELHPPTPPLSPAIADEESLLDLRAALTQLPPQIKETLELRLREELSYEEIALVLQVPLGTVRSRLYTALRLLRQELVSEESIMNPETLETLSMDDALGATSPEVHALLAAYLAHYPAAAAQAAIWRNLTTQTRAALGLAPSAAPPAFPRQRFHAARQRTLLWRLVGTTGLAAACLLAGIYLGNRQPPVAPSAVNIAAQTVSPALAPHAAALPIAQVRDIWSIDRLHQAALQREPKTTPSSPSLLERFRIGGHL